MNNKSETTSNFYNQMSLIFISCNVSVTPQKVITDHLPKGDILPPKYAGDVGHLAEMPLEHYRRQVSIIMHMF